MHQSYCSSYSVLGTGVFMISTITCLQFCDISKNVMKFREVMSLLTARAGVVKCDEGHYLTM